VLQESFKPCLERGRGGEKRGRWTSDEFREAQAYYYPERSKTEKVKSSNSQQDAAGKRRKRSETYSSANLLWQNPENIPIMLDRNCELNMLRNLMSFEWNQNEKLLFLSYLFINILLRPRTIQSKRAKSLQVLAKQHLLEI